ncbi:radical SAM protein [Hirschia maritima]|uniref:radical SAM protein n=1 Tax=Hirschia maritima TaxID=1121961 RepID=UPI000381D8BF|nr:radical SAM protein [Hirschia maritima]
MDEIRYSLKKFDDPRLTAKGERRAAVPYSGTKTLWFNTGTLCNIECTNCYIESSPTNDRLVYLTLADILPYLDELEDAGETQIEIGFTGGEPFLAPQMIEMLEEALVRGHNVLLLTNAMQPMMRPRVMDGLISLRERFNDKLTIRVSLDHFSAKVHDQERGKQSFEIAMTGLRWLAQNQFHITIAGRALYNECEETARSGYSALFVSENFSIDANDPVSLVLFPEMLPNSDPPEITTECWGILDKSPSEIMCSNQRMVVKRKGEKLPTVIPCTLLPYDQRFNMGQTLKEARKAVPLNHSYCATFCVLGGGSCSA